VLNYEEGGENAVLHGDPASEQFLSEMFNPAAFPPPHEHGGHLRIRLARRCLAHPARVRAPRLPLTVFGVSMALQRHPELTAAFKELGHEIACHGWRWISYQTMDEATEREHMRIGMEIIEQLTGERPLGWYTGRDSPNTHRLVADYGGFEYDSDYYGDDLPFWMQVRKTDGRRRAAAHRALHAGHQRHAFLVGAGLRPGRRFLHLPADSLRRAVRRGRSAMV
jgi:allantoinase